MIVYRLLKNYLSLPVGTVGMLVEVDFWKTENWKSHRCLLCSTLMGHKGLVDTGIVRSIEVGQSTGTEKVRIVWMALVWVVRRWLVFVRSFVLPLVCHLLKDLLRQKTL